MVGTLEQSIDRRQHVRRSLRAAATIRYDSGNDVRCTVEDVSAGGVRLRLEIPSTLPPAFILTMAAEPLERSCTVAWQSGIRVGVRFE
jgi:hypothetical protein